jgi:hypothetical protein
LGVPVTKSGVDSLFDSDILVFYFYSHIAKTIKKRLKVETAQSLEYWTASTNLKT